MPQMTGGQALAESLIREGVETVFGLPGVQLDWAFDALYGARDSITTLHTRHEQATAYMADGYARSTGQPGCFIVVPGPGVLNAAGALSTAYSVNSPVLCITGQIQSDLIGIGRGVLHEVDDQLGMLAHITKWNARASTPNEVPLVVHEAFRQLQDNELFRRAMASDALRQLQSAEVFRSLSQNELLSQAFMREAMRAQK